ncbi:HAD-IA family hydrolase [Thermospira aquatica]|uniref:phosphoglycolate phosphatase n=1 Tax=Thermospira aquatica TaxID=2828656 RepID=A0AAX3BBA3_9SPIR|nr:HAD-IA family hydrolase [Thermospira aquatica]URA09546.1 HAD-IA family hydrolase [Thermospira aquatica]
MVRYAAIIWDMDGTLVDSLPVIYEAFSKMLVRFGREPVSREWMKKRIGFPFRETMEVVGLGEDAIQYYREVYFSLWEKHKPFEGIEAVLAELYGKIPMVIVSNKSREGIQRTLSPWNGERWFDLIVSENDVTHPKPHPEAFELVKRFWKEQGKPLEGKDVLMVGDTEIDETFAKNVGMEFAYARWGYGEVNAPDYILKKPSDLIQIVGWDEELPLCNGPELDLHGFASQDVSRVVKTYLDEAYRKGYTMVRVIPGKGKSVRKQQVAKILQEHPLVKDFRESHPMWGGWGSYDVFLKGE